MDSWERFGEISLPDKKPFYCELYLEDITDKDYTHAQKVFKELGLKSLVITMILYVRSDTLLFADVLKTLETSVLKYMNSILLIFCLHPAWQACSKKTEVEAELLLIFICY